MNRPLKEKGVCSQQPYPIERQPRAGCGRLQRRPEPLEGGDDRGHAVVDVESDQIADGHARVDDPVADHDAGNEVVEDCARHRLSAFFPLLVCDTSVVIALPRPGRDTYITIWLLAVK